MNKFRSAILSGKGEVPVNPLVTGKSPRGSDKDNLSSVEVQRHDPRPPALPVDHDRHVAGRGVAHRLVERRVERERLGALRLEVQALDPDHVAALEAVVLAATPRVGEADAA